MTGRVGSEWRQWSPPTSCQKLRLQKLRPSRSRTTICMPANAAPDVAAESHAFVGRHDDPRIYHRQTLVMQQIHHCPNGLQCFDLIEMQ
jgi:hypothetical protein